MSLLKIFTIVLTIVSGAFSLFAQDRVAQAAPATERIDVIKSVHLFPNPAEEFVHVKSEHIQASDVKISLHNIIGNQINAETEVVNEHEIRIRVKDFTSGYYLISLRDDKRNLTATVKFLKR